MITASIPENEEERLNALMEYSILDTIAESDFDNLIAIASEICKTPISTITLVDKDRQWFKARKGLDDPETPRSESFCAHAINEPDRVFTVENAALDPRFHDYPCVIGDPHVAFYAGVPLVTQDGFALGTICVVDDTPRKLTQKQEDTLKALASQVMSLLELRKKRNELEKSMNLLVQKNEQLEKFALIAAHDIKSPIAAISGLSSLLSSDFMDELSEEVKEMIGLINDSSNRVINLVEGILSYSRNAEASEEKLSIDALAFFTDLKLLFPALPDECIKLYTSVKAMEINLITVKQILLNLITNSIKYNDKPLPQINLKITEDERFYHFQVQDNGMGIEEKYLKKIFNMFETVHPSDRFGHKGNGIGLATVKNLINKMGGQISVESLLGEGTTFTFNIHK